MGGGVEGEIAIGEHVKGRHHFHLEGIGKGIHGLRHPADLILAVHVETVTQVPLGHFLYHPHGLNDRLTEGAGDEQRQTDADGQGKEPDGNQGGVGLGGVAAHLLRLALLRLAAALHRLLRLGHHLLLGLDLLFGQGHKLVKMTLVGGNAFRKAAQASRRGGGARLPHPVLHILQPLGIV